jgi:hypothetical protein
LSKDAQDSYVAAYNELVNDEDDPLAVDSNLFRGMYAFVPVCEKKDDNRIIEEDLDAMFTSALIRLHGGMCVANMNNPRLTHVVLTKEAEPKANDLLKQWKQSHASSSCTHPEFIKSELLIVMKEDRVQTTWDLFPRRHEYVIDATTT